MNALPSLFSQPAVDRLGWTLVSFLWQGALIAILYAGVRTLARSTTANTRYLIACAALAVMIVAPLATWVSLGAAPDTAPSSHFVGQQPTVASQAPAPPFSPGAATVRTSPSPILPAVVAVWLAGSLVLSLRLLGGWIVTRRLRSTFVAPAPREWQHALDRLSLAVRVSRPVRLLVSAMVNVPTVIGWLRPVILVPAGALTGLPASQVEALLLHELAHIRRADYLVNLLQSAAEALLFYHPGVWWISGHIRAEREACCDDTAVAVSGDVLAYVQTLADLEASRSAHLRVSMAANGGSLANRIARLLGRPRPVSRSFSALEAVAAAVLLAVTAIAVSAQPAARPKFEVASIKPAPEQGFMMIRPTGGGRLTASAPLMMLIQASYSLQAFQIVGAPAWAESERYAIDAKGEGNPGRPQLMLMLQSLLEDRFGMKIHRETRDLPGYALVLSKSGVKLTAPKEGGCRVLDPATPTPPTPAAGEGALPVCGFVRTMMAPGGVKMEGSKVLMPEFARVISMALGRPVSDKTGYTGAFDVLLQFAPDPSLAGLPRPAGAGDAPPADSASPTIFSALQEQLGLRLESAKAPVEVLVIDRVERPTAN